MPLGKDTYEETIEQAVSLSVKTTPSSGDQIKIAVFPSDLAHIAQEYAWTGDQEALEKAASGLPKRANVSGE